jgi:putative cell wall-binding protein/Tol biopolymer transport system component
MRARSLSHPRASAAVAVTAALALVLLVPAPAQAAPTPAGPKTTMLSVDEAGAAGSLSSDYPSTSEDGRHTAFVSLAPLVAGAGSGTAQVWVRDGVDGTTRLVSSTPGSSIIGGSNQSTRPAISADGRFVAFESRATDLDPSISTDGTGFQVFVRDMAAGGVAKLVSVRATGGAAGNGSSYDVAISADGSTIAFTSEGNDLVSGVRPTAAQVYLAENPLMKPSADVRIASVRDAGSGSRGEIANRTANEPSLSADGTVVSFTSIATNLTDDPTGGHRQVFVHDTTDESTRLVSSRGSGGAGGDADSESSSISADGSRVAYVSAARDIGGPTASPGVAKQVYFRDLRAGPTSVLISHGRQLWTTADAGSGDPSLSGSGDYVAFSSAATDLTHSEANGRPHSYLAHVPSLVTTLVSTAAADETAPSDGNELHPSLSSDGSMVVFSSDALRLVPGSPSFLGQQVYTARVGVPRVERVSEADRYAVSARASARTFGPGAPVAYVASGEVFPDALSGSAAAGFERGPVLLVQRDSVPASVATELARLKPKRIVVLGGASTISLAVQVQLGVFGAPVTRIDGDDRYAVSAELSAKVFPEKRAVAYVASGEVFPDALSASAAAGALDGPVLLVKKDSVPPLVEAELGRLKPSKIVVLGGASTVSESVVKQLGAERVAGADRYKVSAAASAGAIRAPRHTVYVASGEVFPDALSASATAITVDSSVLLVTRDGVPSAVADELRRLKPVRIVILGGTNTVSTAVEQALDAFVVR